MSDNSTRGAPLLYEYINHIIFIFEGSGMILGNLLVITTILLTPRLRRKEMFLLVGLAFGDGLYGMGTFAAGIYRLYLVLSRTDQVLITAWECMRYFQTIFFFIGSQTTAIMMVVLSVDRLMAVVWFSGYMKLTKRYAFWVLRAVAAHAIASTTAAFVSSYFQTDHVKKFPSICISPWAVPRWYAVYNTSLDAFAGFLSVALYLAVVVAYRQHAAAVIGTQSRSSQAAQLKRQRRLTVTLGIVTICTFFFHSIPFSIILAMTVFKVQSSIFGILGPYTWLVVCINSLINILIYIWRQNEIRAAMWGILRCKKASNRVTTIGASSKTRTSRKNPRLESRYQSRGSNVMDDQRSSVVVGPNELVALPMS